MGLCRINIFLFSFPTFCKFSFLKKNLLLYNEEEVSSIPHICIYWKQGIVWCWGIWGWHTMAWVTGSVYAGKQTHREGPHPLSAELEAPSQSRKQLAPRGGPERKASEAWIRSHSERPRTSESEKITNNCEKNRDSNLVGPEDSRASAAGEGGHAAI